MYYFYILLSSLDDNYYYGSTDDLKRRVKQHQDGLVKSTKLRRPLNLVYYEAYLSLENARNREQQVKSSGSARKTLQSRIHKGD